jgi:hypothetical protein
MLGYKKSDKKVIKKLTHLWKDFNERKINKKPKSFKNDRGQRN